MGRRSKQDWLAVIKDQEASGLSVAEYARQHNISIKNLYARRSDFKTCVTTEVNSSSFVEVTRVTEQHEVKQHHLILQIGTASLQLPVDVEANWLGQVIKATQA